MNKEITEEDGYCEWCKRQLCRCDEMYEAARERGDA